MTLRLRPYPKYKPSGVEWLGEIPEQWQTKPLKRTVATINDRSDAADQKLPYTGLENIESWTGRRTETGGQPEVGAQVSRHRSGDVLFGKLRPYLAKATRCDAEGTCSSELLVLRPRPEITRDFLLYCLLSPNFINTVDSSTYGAKMPRANWDFIGSLRVPLPSPAEQRAIAAFLDRETARIDALIEKKQRQIELLQEKRAALITHAVTHGLNPSAPMKDSGVEWLGKVPAHWRVMRLKHISPKQSVGLVIEPSTYVDPSGDVPFLFGANVTAEGISAQDARRITRASNESLPQSRLQAGDLICVRVGYPGLTAVVPPELDGSNCASVMIVRRSPKFDSHWLCYAMNSSVGKAQVEMVQYGAAQKQFNIAHAVEFRFPVPPKSEQEMISRSLSRQTGRLSTARASISRSIDSLREFRTALISAAVTGKLDLRKEVI